MSAIAQRTPEWLDARRTGLGGTDIAAIAGLSPFRSALDVWLDKTAGIEQVENEAMAWGSAVEPLIAAEYTRRTGIVLREGGLVAHPIYPWALGSPDRIAEDRIVEIKTARDARRWADGVPPDYQCQVTWYMGITSIYRADVAVLFAGSEMRIIPVEWDEAMWSDLVAIGADFMARLEAGGPPPEPDGSEAAARALARMYPTDSGAEMVADEEATADVAALLALRARMSEAETAERELESRIKARMGEISTLRGAGFRVTWKRTKDAAVVDWQTVAKAAGADDALVAAHTTSRAGSRRFVVTEDAK